MSFLFAEIGGTGVSSLAVARSRPKFTLGQLVYHHRFEYRGVVIDIDETYALDEEWYEEVATSKPPKDKPWYRVLVHESDDQTYVAEQNLVPDREREPIHNPHVEEYFDAFEDGYYSRATDMLN